MATKQPFASRNLNATAKAGMRTGNVPSHNSSTGPVSGKSQGSISHSPRNPVNGQLLHPAPSNVDPTAAKCAAIKAQAQANQLAAQRRRNQRAARKAATAACVAKHGATNACPACDLAGNTHAAKPAQVFVRSSTGMHHLATGVTLACRAAPTNSRSGIKVVAATLAQVNAACYPKNPQGNFCAKCFPNGKPSQQFIAGLFPSAQG